MTATRFEPPFPSMTSSAFKGAGSVSGIATSSGKFGLLDGDERPAGELGRRASSQGDAGGSILAVERSRRWPTLATWTDSRTEPPPGATRITQLDRVDVQLGPGLAGRRAASRARRRAARRASPAPWARVRGRPGRSRPGSPPAGPRPARRGEPPSAGPRRSGSRPRSGRSARPGSRRRTIRRSSKAGRRDGSGGFAIRRRRPGAGRRRAGSRRRRWSGLAWPGRTRWRLTNVPPGLSRSRRARPPFEHSSDAWRAAIFRGEPSPSWSARSIARSARPARCRARPRRPRARRPARRRLPRTTSQSPAVAIRLRVHDSILSATEQEEGLAQFDPVAVEERPRSRHDLAVDLGPARRGEAA